MTCRCDTPEPLRHPLVIPAGHDAIARQPGTFADHRRALLAAASLQPGLGSWRARSSQEYGVLALELWAYVLDVVGFYDETITHEGFVRTARQTASLRRLVAILGYAPRPAVAARVALAVLADGPDAVMMPAGTGLRSAALPSGGPPQVFETEVDTTVDPACNAWPLMRVRPAKLGVEAIATVLLDPRGVALAVGDVVVVARPGGARVVTVTKLAERVESDGRTYVASTFDRAPGLPAGTPVGSVELLRPTRSLGLWKLPALGGDPAALDLTGTATKLVLDGLHRDVHEGDLVVASLRGDHRWFQVASVAEVQRKVIASLESTATDEDGKTVTVVSPAVTAPVTVLTLDVSVNDPDRTPPQATPWTAADAKGVVLRARLLPAARLATALSRELRPGDPLVVDGPVVKPRTAALPGRFLLAPAAGDGADVTGVLDAADRVLKPHASSALPGALPAPVDLHGNVVLATRGETVGPELLGFGDATTSHPRFTLAKKPLTYVPAPGTELGARSTLEVRVNGRLWHEVASFFTAGPQDEVYIARQREDGGTDVVFGGAGRGAPLPTGAAVSASYRFGAGADMPAARSITQLAAPVAGIAQVRNPVAAWGGADAEGPESVRRFAPRSALLLGRAVSLADMEVAAVRAPGVRAARARWRWSATGQRPVVSVAYIGAAAIAESLVGAIRGLTDPTTPVEAVVASPEPHALALELVVDAALEPAGVTAAARAALADGDGALLAPASIGVEGALLRSVLFEAALAVPGTVAVRGVALDGAPWDGASLTPADGHWLDFVDAGSLTVSGTVAP